VLGFSTGVGFFISEKGSSHVEPAGTYTPRITVVIPTYKRPHLLTRCLAAVSHQECDPSTYEIIVVDDAADKDTKRLIDHWRGELQLPACRYVAVTGVHGPAAARNAGWRAARGEIIAFTDDDCIPLPGWLSAGAAAFADKITAAWGTLIMPVPPQPTDYQRDAAGLARAPFVTANCFVRRAALAAVGGFDERFTAPWREDSDLYFSLLRANATIIHAPEAKVVHPIRPVSWGVSLKQQRKSAFNALLYKKHAQLYRAKIQSQPPWRYYIIVVALLASLSGRLIQLPWLTNGAMITWTVFTVTFCLQRLRGTSHKMSHIAEMIVTSACIPPLAVFWRLYGAARFRVLFF
jgi:glycosyltransferase involved in cell wall biosynthesis